MLPRSLTVAVCVLLASESFVRITAIGLATLVFAGLVSPAAAAGPDLTLDNVQFSEPIVGEKVSHEALKGRVVLLEIWGIN
jgi:hypothetical protein